MSAGRIRHRRASGTLLATLAVIAAGGCGSDRARDGEAGAEQRSADARTSSARAGSARELRVCADPNNMPFSNEAGEGFENAIAELLASELDARVRYTWWAQRRGYVRNTLRAGECDVLVGVPASMEMTLATRPYYRSTYLFVTRRDAGVDISSLDDPRLRKLRVGVQLIGDDYANTPPAHALARRGIVENVRGYSVYGDYTQPNPPSRIIEAVARDEIDVAIAWGPMAAYFASRSAVPLSLQRVTPEIDIPFTPMVFDIAMGVRREDVSLRDELQRVIDRRRTSVDSILEAYHVPRMGQSPRDASGSTDRPRAGRSPLTGGRT
jgi:mxaJ protein